ncbi:MAG: aspartate--ammonia ligase [Oscillospiraceae bacterium]|jgi:aspartate--ammonia ligase
MSKTRIPAGYASSLTLYETQMAIGILKRKLEDSLSEALHLKRVSAPLFVDPSTGLNDNLNGVERPVRFDSRETGAVSEVVHSLAKWKRMALYRYGFPVGQGLYTDMNAIRRDEEMDNLHSMYVDQWDWEKVIAPEDRTMDYLKDAVTRIAGVICDTLDQVKETYPQIPVTLNRTVSFITAQELADLYPEITPKERENRYTKEHKTVFISQIGGPLRSGQPHDGRAPDYDDWALNGDLLFWCAPLHCALEVSSMGVRVDADAMDRQLTLSGCDERRTLPFHQQVLSGTLPLTMGGGIGQSRISMLLLGKAHIGEVQASVWDPKTIAACEQAGVILL